MVNVANVLHLRIDATQQPHQHIEGHRRHAVADMHQAVDRRATNVNAYFACYYWLEAFFPARLGIVKIDVHSGRHYTSIVKQSNLPRDGRRANGTADRRHCGTNATVTTFDPPRLLRSPHVQTVVSRWRPQRIALPANTEEFLLHCAQGVRLKAYLTPGATGAPLAIVIHGWLGCEQSSYVRNAAAVLQAQGYGVARLLLRDHGDTAELNQEMFNSARVAEVVDACNLLIERTAAPAGAIVGFSLGGDVALRLACHERLHEHVRACLAISPVIHPAATVRAIDTGWVAYRLWFVRYWRRALAAKQAAFPGVYDDLDGAMRLSTVAAITDYLVERYLPFCSSNDYYARYDLRGDALAKLRIPTCLVAALDDPVIPGAGFGEIARTAPLELDLQPHGGHCGFVADWRLGSYLDTALTRFFAAQVPLRR